MSLVGSYWVSGPMKKQVSESIWSNLEGKIKVIEYQDERIRVKLDVEESWITQAKMKDGLISSRIIPSK